MKNSIKYRSASYINTKADRIENYSSIERRLIAKGYDVDLTTPKNELLILELKQENEMATLSLSVNGDSLIFSAECGNTVSGQERFDTVVNKNIDGILAAIELRMN